MSKRAVTRDAATTRQPAAPRDPEWRQWIQDLGAEIRRMRTHTGLSQDELARRAGVSQGAVSRLEKARGLATPLVVVMRILLAVAAELRNPDGTPRSEDARSALERHGVLLHPLAEPGAHPLRIPGDPNVQELVSLYRNLPPRQRQSLIAVLRAVVTALQPTAVVVALSLFAS